jgi:hypothetical protein
MSTESDDIREGLAARLNASGWAVAGEGNLGVVWRPAELRASTSGREPSDEVSIVIPWRLTTQSFEYRGVVERVAAATRISFQALDRLLRHMRFDVSEFRLEADDVSETSRLAAGVALLDSVRTLFRASATASRTSRPSIDGRYSQVGDEIASEARMAHTKRGSFVVPILMPIPPDEPDPAVPQLAAMAPPESGQRRVTRTMAQALSAMKGQILDAPQLPSRSMLADLVVAGVTRESVMAVQRVLIAPGVTELDASFEWAAGHRSTQTLPTTVEFPRDAAPVLAAAADLMRTSRMSVEERLSGVVVEVRHEPNDPFSEFAIGTVVRGRSCEVRVTIPSEDITKATQWLVAGDVIVVSGPIERQKGRPLRIRRPTGVYRLAEGQLFQSQP